MPVYLYIKNGAGVKLAYSISYAYRPISTKYYRMVYYNTRKTAVGPEKNPSAFTKSVVLV